MFWVMGITLTCLGLWFLAKDINQLTAFIKNLPYAIGLMASGLLIIPPLQKTYRSDDPILNSFIALLKSFVFIALMAIYYYLLPIYFPEKSESLNENMTATDNLSISDNSPSNKNPFAPKHKPVSSVYLFESYDTTCEVVAISKQYVTCNEGSATTYKLIPAYLDKNHYATDYIKTLSDLIEGKSIQVRFKPQLLAQAPPPSIDVPDAESDDASDKDTVIAASQPAKTTKPKKIDNSPRERWANTPVPAEFFLNMQNINLTLVDKGMAGVNHTIPLPPDYIKNEINANQKQVGVWKWFTLFLPYAYEQDYDDERYTVLG